MRSEELDVRTDDRLVTDLTPRAVRFCAGAGDGLLSVFVPHATAGVALLETGAGSEADLATALDLALPPDDRWVHRHGSSPEPALAVPDAQVEQGLCVLGGLDALRDGQAHAGGPQRRDRGRSAPSSWTGACPDSSSRMRGSGRDARKASSSGRSPVGAGRVVSVAA